MILIIKKSREPPYPPHYDIFWQKGGYFEKLSKGSEALSNKNMRIPHPKKNGDPPSHLHYAVFWWTKGGIFKSPRAAKTLGLTSVRLGEMFEGYSADMCA
jgi:hypothetical protein